MVIVGKKLNEELLLQHYDIIVIGSGLGSMASATLLALAGKKVLILEQHYTLGGLTHAFSRKGFFWDVGVHYIGEVHDPNSPLRKVFDLLTGKKLTWSSLGAITEKVTIGKREILIRKGRGPFLEELIKEFQEEELALRKYLEIIEKIFKSSPHYFIARLFPSFTQTFLSLFLGRSFRDYLNSTTQEVLDSLFKSEELKAALTSFYGDYNLPPHRSPFALHASVAAHYLEGGNYPDGGAHQIARHILETLEQNGGQAFTRAKVKEIIIEENKAVGVRLESGLLISCDKVISGCGVQLSLSKLIKPSSLAPQYRDSLLKLEPSASFFSLYLGLKSDAPIEKLPIENHWIHPNSNFKENWNNKERLPFLFISFPSKRNLEQREKHTIIILAKFDFDRVKEWKDQKVRQRGGDYLSLKEDLKNECLNIFYEHYPFLENQIEVYETASPLSHQFYSNNLKGEPYGLSPTKERFLCQELKPKTPIKGLYFTGVDITIAGVAPALSSALLTSLAIHPLKVIRVLLRAFK